MTQASPRTIARPREESGWRYRRRCLLVVCYFLVAAYVLRGLLYWDEHGSFSPWMTLALLWTGLLTAWLEKFGNTTTVSVLLTMILFGMETRIAIELHSSYSVFFVWAPIGTALVGIVGGLGASVIVFCAGLAASLYLLQFSPNLDADFVRAYPEFLKDRTLALLTAEFAAVLLFFLFRYMNDNAERDLKKKRLLRAKTSRKVAIVDVLGSLAHEVNNPLAILHASLLHYRSKLQSRSLTVEMRLMLLANMEAAIGRIHAVTDNLRTFAEGDVNEPMQLVDLSEILQTAKRQMDEKALQAGTRILIDGGHRRMVLCRRQQVLFVVLVFLDNALDALDGKTEAILIRAHYQDGMTRVEVEDHGHGVQDELRDKIFQPFVTSKPAGKSLGMDLSICQGIIQEHSGEIGFYPLKSGTTFWFALRDPERGAA